MKTETCPRLSICKRWSWAREASCIQSLYPTTAPAGLLVAPLGPQDTSPWKPGSILFFSTPGTLGSALPQQLWLLHGTPAICLFLESDCPLLLLWLPSPWRLPIISLSSVSSLFLGLALKIQYKFSKELIPQKGRSGPVGTQACTLLGRYTDLVKGWRQQLRGVCRPPSPGLTASSH